MNKRNLEICLVHCRFFFWRTLQSLFQIGLQCWSRTWDLPQHYASELHGLVYRRSITFFGSRERGIIECIGFIFGTAAMESTIDIVPNQFASFIAGHGIEFVHRRVMHLCGHSIGGIGSFASVLHMDIICSSLLPPSGECTNNPLLLVLWPNWLYLGH